MTDSYKGTDKLSFGAFGFMCRDDDHGGRRCPNDNSAARQARRVAAKRRKETASKGLTSVTGYVRTPEKISATDLTAIRAKAAELKERIYGAVPEGMTQDEFDAQMEVEMTYFGKTLGERAESLVGFRLGDFEDKIRAEEARIYGEGEDVFTKAEDELDNANIAFREQVTNRLREEKPELMIPKFVDARKVSQMVELEGHDKELYERVVEAQTNMDALTGKKYRADKEFGEAVDRIFGEGREKLSNAYQRVLREIRDVGGEIDYDETRSDPEAVAIMKDSVDKMYPSDWIKAHNATTSDGFLVKMTDVRAGYTEKDILDEEGDAEYVPPVYTHFSVKESLAPIVREALAPYVKDDGNYAEGQVSQGMKLAYFRLETETDEPYDEALHGPRDEFNKPQGEGWEFRHSYQSVLNAVGNSYSEYDLAENVKNKMWVRKKTTRKRMAPTLAIYNNDTIQKLNYNGSVNGVALHEFGHRMENVLPDKVLARQERAFLRRRSIKDNFQTEFGEELKNQDYADLIPITGSPGEFSQRASMVHNYMSREYFTGKNYEVFTTGIEALYGGGFGGLMSLDKNYARKDFEHRGFVLGALATL